MIGRATTSTMDTCISLIPCLLFSPVLFILLRAIYLIFKIHTSDCRLTCEKSLKTILCIGSGGHTMELMRLVKNLNFDKYCHRLYILAENDISSKVKIDEVEDRHTDYAFNRIPRSRNVSQSYLSSVFSTVYATMFCVPIVFNFKPNVIFCNGPGTCIPICVVAFVLRCLFIIDCRIVFIESICRIRTLSLSGKILQYIADIFIVQWPQLRDVCYRAKYFGRLT